MWARGRIVADTLRLDAGAGLTFHFFSGSGSLALAATDGGDYFKARNDGSKTWWVYSPSRPPIDFQTRWKNLGNETRFARGGLVVIRDPARGTIGGLLIPCLPVAGAVAALSIGRLLWYRFHARKRRRIRAGLCPDCGHDMRTLTERCAQCGRARVRGMRVRHVHKQDSSSRAA